MTYVTKLIKNRTYIRHTQVTATEYLHHATSQRIKDCQVRVHLSLTENESFFRNTVLILYFKKIVALLILFQSTVQWYWTSNYDQTFAWTSMISIFIGQHPTEIICNELIRLAMISYVHFDQSNVLWKRLNATFF